MNCVGSVVIVNAREVSSFFPPAEESPAVATMLRLLGDAGVGRISVFPSDEEERDLLDYENKFKNFLKRNQADIVAFSCWTSGYGIASDMAAVAREVLPGALLTAGGPHFSSPEEIENSLYEKEYDFIFRGGASPFADFCRSYFSGSLIVERLSHGLSVKGEIPEKGLCYLNENGKPVIAQRGRLKGPVVPVTEINDLYADIRVIIDDACPNGCDYCCIEPSVQSNGDRLGFFREAGSFIKAVKRETGLSVRFSLADSAPFVRRKALVASLEEFLKIDPEASFSLFADPRDIDGDMFDIIDRYRITSLFFGRDRVVEDVSLGRKYRGRLRTASELDDEKERLLSLVDFLGKRKKGGSFEIYIGYILSPFEDEAGSFKMSEEIKLFSCVQPDGNTTVQANLFILDPYPGTEVARRFEGGFIPMRYFRHPYPNPWTAPMAVHAQMEFTRLVLSKILCAPGSDELRGPLIDFIHGLQHGKETDASLAEEPYDKSLRVLARYIMEEISGIDFSYRPGEPAYSEGIVKTHLTGCTAMAMLARRDWLKRGIFESVREAVVRNDGILPLLLKDLETVKYFASLRAKRERKER